MSDENVNQPTDEDDTVDEESSAEDIALAESVDLRSLGIDPLSTPIEDLLKLYRENHATVQEYTKAQKTGKADPSDPTIVVKTNVTKLIKSSDENIKTIVQHVRSIGERVADATFTKLEENNGLLESTVLLEEMENLVSLLKDEQRYHFDNAVQRMKSEQGIKTTPSESAVMAKATCVKLRDLIENRVNIAQLVDPSSLPANLIKVAEEGKRGGFNTDVFPKTPRLDMGDLSPASPSSTVHLTFRFIDSEGNAVEVADGTTLGQVAHDVVSKGSYRITRSDVEKRLKKEGHGIGATETEWSLEFKTGVLFGRKSS